MNVFDALNGIFALGGPVVAILGEFDALPYLSQEPGIAEPRPLEAGGNGHGCGHNLLGAAALLAATALAALAVTAACCCALPAAADWTKARCDIYPKGSDKLEKMIPCTFGQRQGHITITREDGVTHDLSPVGDTPGNFRDQDGNAVYRQSGLGEAGLIFRFPSESVFVYWDNAASEPAAAGVAMISASTAVISERSAMPGTFVSPANLIFVPVMSFIMLLLMNM